MIRKSEGKIPTGGTYLLVIVIIFALAVFGILAIKSSNAELKIAKETRSSVEAYYKADSEAEHILMRIGKILDNYYNDTSGIALKVQLQDVIGKKGQVEAENDKKGIIRYEVRLADHRVLRVKLSYNIEIEAKKTWDIVSWKVN